MMMTMTTTTTTMVNFKTSHHLHGKLSHLILVMDI
jgi:hypothetical protein